MTLDLRTDSDAIRCRTSIGKNQAALQNPNPDCANRLRGDISPEGKRCRHFCSARRYILAFERSSRVSESSSDTRHADRKCIARVNLARYFTARTSPGRHRELSLTVFPTSTKTSLSFDAALGSLENSREYFERLRACSRELSSAIGEGRNPEATWGRFDFRHSWARRREHWNRVWKGILRSKEGEKRKRKRRKRFECGFERDAPFTSRRPKMIERETRGAFYFHRRGTAERKSFVKWYADEEETAGWDGTLKAPDTPRESVIELCAWCSSSSVSR